jgi:hypothetical protein
MTVVRVTAVLAPVSALPRDEVTNSFHFREIGDLEGGELEQMTTWVDDFYTVAAGASVPLMNNIAKSVADTGHEIRCYVYDEVTGERLAGSGAPPELVTAMSFSARGTELVGLPNEVALKVSIRNNSEVGVPLARRTGGVYLGPFESVIQIEGDGSRSQPQTALVTQCLDAMEVMAEASLAGTNELVIWSRPFAGRAEVIRPGKPPLPALPARDGALYQVEQVFCDDEWDTIRRRGRPAGARSVRAVT